MQVDVQNGLVEGQVHQIAGENPDLDQFIVSGLKPSIWSFPHRGDAVAESMSLATNPRQRWL